ncbi:MAG: MFS transporter [Ignavibacteriae bacterium]|nr:MFS transporter [Ignavibacteriota bacterium]
MKIHSEKDLKNKLDNKFKIFVWSLFDFANTSFSIIVVTFIFAVYFKNVIAEGKPIGDLYWSFGISISMIITGFFSPILGAISDYSTGKKRFLLFFTLLCVISTSLLYFTSEGDIYLALILFIIANIGFEAGLVFYDSFLPELTSEKNYGRVSGYGFAMGYLGSLIVLAISLPLIKENLIQETFPLAALFFFIFAIPLFVYLKDSKKNVIHTHSYLSIGLQRVYSTVTHLKEYKNLSIYLLAFFFYIEGVNTVIFFSGNYASTTLNFTMEELIIFFLIVQTTAIFGSVLFGVISDSIGQKKAITISLFIWIFTIFIAYFSSDENTILIEYLVNITSMDSAELMRYSFYFVGLIAGSVMGATQSTSRSLMTKLTPVDKKTEFFGFYSLFGKSSAVVGPLVFGFVSYLSGNQRFAILSVGIFFIIGLFLLKFVDDGSVNEVQS